MLGIVSLHALGHGGILNMTSGTLNGSLLWGLESISYFSVNIFVLITGFFMCESSFKLQKLFRLILDITFWALVCFFVFTTFSGVFTIKGLITSTVGSLTGLYWFPTVYLALYIISPFLNILSRELQRKQFTLLLITTVFLSTLPIFSSAIGISGTSLSWFITLYLTGAFLRRSSPSKKILWLIGFILSVGLLWSIKVIPITFVQTYGNLLWNYNSVVCWLGSVCAFQLFRSVTISSKLLSATISLVATGTFGIYLIHDNEYIRDVFWEIVCYLFALKPSTTLIPKTLIAILCVFISCLLLELLRLWLFRLCHIDKLLKTIAQNITNTVTNWLAKFS